MKIFKIKWLVLLVGVFVLGSALAQTEVLGQKGKILYLTNASGGNTFAMSSNGTYIGGFFGNIGGFVYNRLKDTLEFTDAAILGISNDGLRIGNFLDSTTMIDGEPLITACTYRNGKWIPWEFIPKYGTPAFWGQGIQARAISDDGSISTGMAWCGNYTQYIGALWKGDKYAKLLPLYWDVSTEGGFANVMSGDGKINAGYCAWWIGDQQITGRAPIIWDSTGTPFVIGDTSTFLKVTQAGEVKGLNRNGSIAVGSMVQNDVATAFMWNKENGVRFLGTLETWRGSVAMDISENGIVVGYTTGFGLTGEYEGFVWTQEMGMISLSQYLKELYGLNLGLQNMRMPMKISDDGRVIAGYTMISGARIPYIITLDEEVLNTRPLLLVAKQEKDAMRVKLSWNLPIYNGKKILGYAIYRDSVKVNTDLITDCSYIDEGMPEGKHSYQITTIYASGESAMSDAVKVEVVGIGGCYSVKYIQSELVYNKTAKIHWGVPTSAISSASMPQFSLPNTFDEKTQIQPLALCPNLSSMKIQNSIEAPDTMDLVNVYGLKSNGVVSLVKLGDYYYGANINQAGFTKYSAQMEVLGVVKIPNLPAIWNITTDGQYIYCGATTKFIYKVDIAEGSIVAQYKTDEKVRHLCYIPQLDNGNGGFELGDWESSILVDKKGKKISEGLSLKNAFGTAYHKGYIYAHQQIGTGCLINQYDVNTKQFTNFSLDPTTYSEVKALVSQGAYAAGISVLTMEDSTICLVPVIQGNDGKNTAVFIELEAMPHLKGFNIYRNEQKLNTLPLSKRHFSEVLSIPGTYTYQVSAVFDNACESEKIDASPLNVEPILPCPSVKNLEVNEQNQNVYLRWVSPPSYSSSLLGYILYKDGQKEVDLFRKHIFIDTMVNIGLHTYIIEAFYENSCLAVDSIQIEVTHQGLCAAANYLKLESQQTTNSQFDVHASWELPYMETPLTLRYDNYENAMTVGFTGGGDPTVAVGWTAEQLATYNGFYLIGMEIFVEEGFSSLIPMVMVDEKVVYSKKADNVPTGQFTQLYFDQAIPIQTAKKELMVGYTIKHAEGTFPIGIGQTAVNKNYGDLFSLDLITWYSAAEKLGLTSNWNIAALLVKPRDVSKNSKWSASLIKPKEPVQIGSVTIDKLKLLEQKSKNSTYSTLDTLKLLGFDLYRDGAKINTERILDLQYTDKNLEKGNYQYLVNTIWNRCDEIPSKIAKITLSPTPIEGENVQKDFVILPNPAQDHLFIVGEYQRFEIINSYGQICMKGNAQKSSFSITNLNSGMYLVRIYTSSGQAQIRKLIVHK